MQTGNDNVKSYLNLKLYEKIECLRNNGYYYDVEHSKIDVEELLKKYEVLIEDAEPSKEIPNLTPVKAYFIEGHKEFIISYSLFMSDKVFSVYRNPESLADLKSGLFDHQGKDINFYDCFVANIILSAKFLNEHNYNAKVRVYLAENLHPLFDVLCEHGIEVFVIRESESKPNKNRADYWRFLAYGDDTADYTICYDSDAELSHNIIRLVKLAFGGGADFFTEMSANNWNNCIDGDNFFSFTYVHGGLNAMRNKSDFFQKYKIGDLIIAYHLISAVSGFGEVLLYPVPGKDQKDCAVRLGSYSTGLRSLTEYCGDQCFLSSVLFFWFAERGKFALYQHRNAPIVPAGYHLFYSYPYLKFINRLGNKIIDNSGRDTSADFLPE